jgi:sugar lactone lactonase YvrE
MYTQHLEAGLFLDTKAQLGEGCFWHPKENKLYWIDIEKHELHITDVVSKEDKCFNCQPAAILLCSTRNCLNNQRIICKLCISQRGHALTSQRMSI